MHRVTFDLDILRTFVTGIELGSFARAANRLGRSTSAVSAQLKKLEDQAGTPVLRKAGRGMALTEAGETLLSYARRLLELNDEASAAMRSTPLSGRVRLGLQEDFGESLLADVLGRFARTHERVRIEARIARNAELLAGVHAGELDFALRWQNADDTAHTHGLGEIPMCWLGGVNRPEPSTWRASEPLPLVVLEAPCLFRTVATTTLDRAGIPWRIAFTSPSLNGVWAAVSAGLGITVRTGIGLPVSVGKLRPDATGLPALPRIGLTLDRAESALSPAASALAEMMQDHVARLPAADGSIH